MPSIPASPCVVPAAEPQELSKPPEDFGLGKQRHVIGHRGLSPAACVGKGVGAARESSGNQQLLVVLLGKHTFCFGETHRVFLLEKKCRKLIVT